MFLYVCLFIVLLYFRVVCFFWVFVTFVPFFSFSTLILLVGSFKTVSQITYTVLVETLNPAQSTRGNSGRETINRQPSIVVVNRSVGGDTKAEYDVQAAGPPSRFPRCNNHHHGRLGDPV